MSTRQIERLEDLPLHCVRSLRGLRTEQLREWAKAADQRFVLADLSGCRDKPSAMRMLGHAFNLPEWFGANLDALYDSLTDEDTWHVGRGAVVVIDPLPYTERFGVEERDALLDVLRDVAEHYSDAGVPFRVFYRSRRDAGQAKSPTVPWMAARAASPAVSVLRTRGPRRTTS